MIILEEKTFDDGHGTKYICCELMYDSESYLTMYSKTLTEIKVYFAEPGFKNWRVTNESNAVEKKISKLLKEKFS
tara:strand:- start:1567 stop:1791 length:225 start_codon:yes stop_codon:yes gene_type:complete